MTSGVMPVPNNAVTDLRGPIARLGRLNRNGWRYAADLASIALGAAPASPAHDDSRFRDAAWTEHPYYRRLEQAYLASCAFADETLDTLGRSTSATRFLLNIVQSAAAPTNTFLGNPAAMKRAYETGGLSLLRGMRNFLGDAVHNGGMPSIVDRSAYAVGRDLAITPGAVVERDPVAELIQYTPGTEQVHARPVLVIPPPIGRYYFLDLRPGRSFVEYSVSRGLQTFMLSWRNPTSAQGDWTLETYVERVLSAIEAVREVAGHAGHRRVRPLRRRHPYDIGAQPPRRCRR